MEHFLNTLDLLEPSITFSMDQAVFLVVVLQVVLARGFLLERWVTFKTRHCPGASHYAQGGDNKPFPKGSWERSRNMPSTEKSHVLFFFWCETAIKFW